MTEKKYKSPLIDWKENNQSPNLAFTLVAGNERAKQMWADPYNSSRYVPASFTRKGRKDPSAGDDSLDVPESENKNDQSKAKGKKDTEPALRFLFNNWPKDFAKGYVLGSDDKSCDALLGDPGDQISEQALAFTFNQQHELVMNVTSDKRTSVTFNEQKVARRTRFSWIFPRAKRNIRVLVEGVLEFEVLLPKYGIYNKDEFHRNCESFLNSAAGGIPPGGDLEFNSTAIAGQASGTPSPWEPFYLRGTILGSGAYGDVQKVLRMPDGKVFAAKSFKHQDVSFRQEVDMFKKVCRTFHVSRKTCLAEWIIADRETRKI